MDEALIAELNRGYACPSDAGPAWRAAYEAGIDMPLIEDNLKLTPWERLLANDRALALVRAVENAKPLNDGATY